MGEQKWTAGPWRVEYNTGGDQGVRADNHGYIAFISHRGPNPERNEAQIANAYLIAAAPDLFEALSKATAAVNRSYEQAHAEWHRHDTRAARCDKTVREFREAARAALAKARGETT